MRPVGERAVLVEFESMAAVHRLWAELRARPVPGVEDVVAGARTVLLVMAEGAGDALEVARRLPEPASVPRPPARRVTIPVVYDGPDLEAVGAASDLSAAEVARRHAAATYTVGFLGFSPGFAYLYGGDPRLAVSRRPVPRASVPAGSVALAGGLTAVYPQATPGGWHLLGRTETVMFDPARPDPARLGPGDTVRFEPVDGINGPQVPTLRSSLRSPPPGTAAVQIIEAGPLLTIQDGGRRGWGHVGVPVAGAADRGSARWANRLVGNGPDAAGLEALAGRCRLRLTAARTLAVTGARTDLTVDGLPARQDAPLALPAGAEVGIGSCRDGIRVYVALAGGLEVEEVLGSRSTDTLSGLGPPPLSGGDVVGLGRPDADTSPDYFPAPPVRTSGLIEVSARLGPREDWLSATGRAQLEAGEFVVAPSSDRTGLRLTGPVVDMVDRGDLPSEGVVAGAVQVPPGGEPIVLMRNHPATGGYPVVAVVDDEGVDALAQAAPGRPVRFRLVRS